MKFTSTQIFCLICTVVVLLLFIGFRQTQRDTKILFPIRLDCNTNTYNSTPPNVTITNQTKIDSPVTPVTHVTHFNITRRIFPQLHPTVCIAFLSCNRYDLLHRHMHLLFRHFENVESIPYEVVIVENGCGSISEFHELILTSYQIDKYTVMSSNRGIAAGINALFFGLCSAPYVLSVEDDWEFVATENIFERAIKVLSFHTENRLEPSLIGIYMGHGAYYEQERDRDADGVVYRVIESSGSGWCFANGGTFLRRDALINVGYQKLGLPGPEAELMYKMEVYNKGYRMGSLIRNDTEFMRGFEHRGHHINEPQV